MPSRYRRMRHVVGGVPATSKKSRGLRAQGGGFEKGLAGREPEAGAEYMGGGG